MKITFSIIIVAVLGLIALAGCSPAQQLSDQGNTDTPVDAVQTKTFVLTGVNFKFLMDGQEAPELRVNEGDIVRIEFTSVDGFHDWVVDEFEAATPQVKSGEEASSTFVEFVADKKGVFEYYCSVGQHRANGMKGNLIVE